MGGRAVEGTGLENRQACKRLVGSNPTPSATNSSYTFHRSLIYSQYTGVSGQFSLRYVPLLTYPIRCIMWVFLW